MVCAIGSEAFRSQYDVTTFTTFTLRQSPNMSIHHSPVSSHSSHKSSQHNENSFNVQATQRCWWATRSGSDMIIFGTNLKAEHSSLSQFSKEFKKLFDETNDLAIDNVESALTLKEKEYKDIESRLHKLLKQKVKR